LVVFAIIVKEECCVKGFFIILPNISSGNFEGLVPPTFLVFLFAERLFVRLVFELVFRIFFANHIYHIYYEYNLGNHKKDILEKNSINKTF
jgi:hypothetical protein